jgi:hypothetical protein
MSKSINKKTVVKKVTKKEVILSSDSNNESNSDEEDEEEEEEEDCEYVVGIHIDDFVYDFCENYDLSFLDEYVDDTNEYEKSLAKFAKTKRGKKIGHIGYFSDFNDGENDEMYFRLLHFIKTFMKTNLCFYTENSHGNFYNGEPLYLGILTDNNSKKNVNEIIKSFDFETYNKVLDFLEFKKGEKERNPRIYKLNDWI